MRFVNVRELKAKISEILRQTDKGEEIVITYRGKPKAILRNLREDELEDYILENHPEIRAKVESDYKVYRENGGIDIEDMIRQTEKEIAELSS